MKLMKFKRVAVTVLIVLAAYLLQCTLFNHLELAGIKPNLILIVTASFGFMRGQKEGMLVGFFARLITDIRLYNFGILCITLPGNRFCKRINLNSFILMKISSCRYF